MKRCMFVTALVLAWASAGEAQTGVSLAPAMPARWDLSGEVGWLGSNKADVAVDWDDWYDEWTGGASVGRYWTSHLKTELRFAFSGEGRIYEEERLVVPGQPYPTFRLHEHAFRKTTVGGSGSYQFFENRWFHPYVGAGFELERESHQVDGVRDVAWRARPVASAGFKWYASERGFARSDVRVSFGGDGVSHVVWTVGVGVDL